MRIGRYPGTFDPLTLGHMDIINRACALVDRLVIGVAINRDKGPLFSLDERVAMVEGETAALSERTGVEIVVHPFETRTSGGDGEGVSWTFLAGAIAGVAVLLVVVLLLFLRGRGGGEGSEGVGPPPEDITEEARPVEVMVPQDDVAPTIEWEEGDKT